jgi:hypothetical protein
MTHKSPDERFLTTFTSASTLRNFKETPVSFIEFISNERFVGKLTNKGAAIYPVWKRELSFLMVEPTKYIPVLTGAIGIGKSRLAILGIAFVMYIHLCLRDPWAYYGKAAGGKMAIVFFNLNKTLGESKGYKILQNYLLSSEWFLERGRVSGNLEKQIHFDLFEFVLASPYAQAELGQDVIAALMDEVDSPKAGLKQREKVIASVESALRRFEDRFVQKGQSLGKFFIVASKQENLSFLNAFIAKKKQNKEVHIIDIPIWEAKEEEFHGTAKFPVQIGDMYAPTKILHSEEEVKDSITNGFQIVHVPEQFRRAFEEDPTGALRDLAGISATYLRKNKVFKSEKYLLECYDPKKEDPVSMDTIFLGMKEEDKELKFFMDVDKIRTPRYIPRFIHGDIAFSHDAYGLAMSAVAGWAETTSTREDGSIIVDKSPVIETDFLMRIKAPENDEIDLSKVRKFIIDLKNIHGFNICQCSFDLKLASTDTTQLLKKAGIDCKYVSIDKNPQYCRNFRDDLVKQGRWICHKHPYLHFELISLEEDPVSNKIDHPKEVVIMQTLKDGSLKELPVEGSKDLSDAVIGSVITALEECKVPPDIEIMRKVFTKATQSEERAGLWWVDEGSLGRKKKGNEDEIEKTIRHDFAARYADIFRKSQQ